MLALLSHVKQHINDNTAHRNRSPHDIVFLFLFFVFSLAMESSTSMTTPPTEIEALMQEVADENELEFGNNCNDKRDLL